MADLTLTLKKKWFDMIESGEKTEEYREIKMYWATRLCGGFPSVYGIERFNPDFKDLKDVLFVNGYSKESRRMIRKILNISIGEGKPEWGAEPGKQYYVISLTL